MSKPVMVEVPLTELADGGVLMAANERFFWPLGLALTWRFDPRTATATGLYVSEWRYDDGHHEAIGIEEHDGVAADRREQFLKWLSARVETMPPDEAERAAALLADPGTPIVLQKATDHG